MLLYIPIVHTEADMGALGPSVQRLTLSRVGLRGWKLTCRLIDQFWSQVERVIRSLDLRYERVRVYQDGLPEDGHELRIVAELAKAGSRNHRLLLELKDRGATIMGTECPALLMEEYELVKAELASGARPRPRGAGGRRAAEDALLAKRDQHIAERIDRTLGAGETGLLFVGALHAVAGLLPPDIRVAYPMHKPVHPATGGL